jgi:hypothetical protein
MSKTVDCIERYVMPLWDLKVGHVCHKGIRFDAVTLETCIAEVDSFGVQIQTRDSVPSLGQ